MSLKVAQAKNKKDVFNEIKSKYSKYERVGSKAEDKPRYWDEKNFTFIPPDGGVDKQPEANRGGRC